ncbi:MAG TPA: hypothetical protein VKV74_06225 [Bryobacteraceae bacterium]|nr:hypothetical protein [Bryobacteraceae bacterium]
MRGCASILGWGLIIASVPAFASSLDADDVGTDIVTKYLNATKTQQQALRGARMEVDIVARLPKLEKQGRLKALRFVSRLGKITYKALGFSGDNTVKQDVIARYLSLETGGHDTSAIEVTPANYRFRLKARMTQGDRLVDVLQLDPKKKHWWSSYKVGLFKGELWLDADTGMPIRVSGEWVKSPSVFVKKVEFVQEFELRDGVSLPSHLESTVDTRIVGRAELSINFTNFTPEGSEQDEDEPISQVEEVSTTP